jgi:hypothetical protein
MMTMKKARMYLEHAAALRQMTGAASQSLIDFLRTESQLEVERE